MLQLPLFLLAAAMASTTPASMRPSLYVTLDATAASLPPAAVEAIVEQVRDIWAPHVDLNIRLSAPGLPAGTLSAVIADGPLADADATTVSLGAITFAGAAPLNRVVISVAAARRLAAGAYWRGAPVTTRPPKVVNAFLARALARALAHEIGHYLLRSPEHEASGLMRARFTPEEILDPNIRRYALTQVDRMRLASRFAGLATEATRDSSAQPRQ